MCCLKLLHFHRVIVVCFSENVINVLMQVSNSILTGITRFDLLGDFGRFNWLGNFYIVLSYNLLFAIMTTLCLVRKFTSAVREELLKALGNNSTGNLVCTSYYFSLALIPCSVTSMLWRHRTYSLLLLSMQKSEYVSKCEQWLSVILKGNLAFIDNWKAEVRDFNLSSCLFTLTETPNP